jgi:hypothetical protein
MSLIVAKNFFHEVCPNSFFIKILHHKILIGLILIGCVLINQTTCIVKFLIKFKYYIILLQIL